MVLAAFGIGSYIGRVVGNSVIIICSGIIVCWH